MDLPDWLESAVVKVLHDMREPRPLVLEVSYAPPFGKATRYGATVFFDDRRGEKLEFEIPTVPDEGTEADLLLALAEELPWYVSELAQAWGESRPVCPGHTHPAAPSERDGRAWWTCPVDGTPLAPIGEL